ncbi:Defender against death DAD protein [Niveomyces insectorum RCEF 264]|uniref:Dolichyl-diphosphooligosaccharide--protein glycosyltransferase subunit OST2 n=1 Tax=Niveomyces insectorum RCEF 264 TaxID=1081102 RepID=A0A167VHK4_9HYPO|nr:Defender against death DAD protein [Niveomyces insectorum RCEF 264]
MARRSAAAAAGAATSPAAATTTTTTSPAGPSFSAASSGHTKHGAAGSASSWQNVVHNLLRHYEQATPQRTKLLDAFMAFLVVVGGLQFVYCVLAGNYPFNAFLSGFSSTVGQFVLTASLRIQTTEANKADFPSVSPERAFADYVFCSLILHFFCINFIN